MKRLTLVLTLLLPLLAACGKNEDEGPTIVCGPCAESNTQWAVALAEERWARFEGLDTIPLIAASEAAFAATYETCTNPVAAHWQEPWASIRQQCSTFPHSIGRDSLDRLLARLPARVACPN